MATAAEMDFQTVVRAARYAIEDIANLDHNVWFKHDDTELAHSITRDGERFTFTKSYFSRYKPLYIGYRLQIPLSTGLAIYTIWITDPVEDTTVNRRAAVEALERFISRRNLKSVEISTTELK